MADVPRYSIQLSITDRHTGDRWTQAVDEHEFPVFSERFVDELKFSPSLALGPSKDAGEAMSKMASVLRKREFRKDYLMSAATTLARRLADYMSDREGWNGAERRERILEREKEARGY